MGYMLTGLPGKIKIWFKENEKDVVLAIGVFLIAVISFGLGILFQKDQAPIVVEDSKYCATSPTSSVPGDAGF